MRVLDIINEGPVHPLQTVFSGIGVTNPIGWNNHKPNQVVSLKKILKQHKLVTGRNQAGRTTGGMAWTGDESEEWTPALDAALSAWKRSINLQIDPNNPNNPLDLTNPPTLRAIDVRFLLAKLTTEGFLEASAEGGMKPQNIFTKGPLEGMTYEKVIPGTREDAVNTSTMVEAVGQSAWWRIASEILERKFSTEGQSWLQTTPKNERGRMILEVYNKFFMQKGMPFPDELWLQNVNRAAGNTKAVFLDGTEQSIAFTQKITAEPKELFDYYSSMALKLWEKDTALDAEAKQARTAAANAPVTAETIDATTMVALAQDLVDALDNKLSRKLNPFDSGGFFNDVDAVRAVFGKLRTAKDFDNLSLEYQKLTNNKLHEELVDELDKDDYENIVISKLIAIRRIAPTMIYKSIQFGSETEIPVTGDDGKVYKIANTKDATDDHYIVNYNGYDAILVDELYRKAVEQTGGTLPDFDKPADNAAIERVKPLFIQAINQSFPEMVAFYVRAEPFDQASVDLGNARLNGILDDAARLGDDEDAIKAYITEQIGNDREFLIEGKDGGEPGANIYFDPKYRDEGLADRDFTVLTADEDVELNITEEQIKSALLSTDKLVVREAVDELLQDPDGATKYENIYRDTYANRTYLDELATFGDGEADIKQVISGSTTNNTPISDLAREFGIAIAAPRVSAQLFKKSIFGAGTDDETITDLINNIRDRKDYEFIDERYRDLPGVDDSLIDDLAGEQFIGLFGYGYYKQLADKIGDSSRLDLIRVELPTDVINRLEDVQATPNEETVKKLKQKIGSDIKSNEDQLEIIIDRLTETLDNIQDQSSPQAVILGQLIRDLYADLDKL